MKKYRKVLVVWHDAVTAMGWENHDDAVVNHGTQGCESIGYLIHRTKTDVVLAQTISHDGQINGRVTIPVVWLRAPIVTLKGP